MFLTTHICTLMTITSFFNIYENLAKRIIKILKIQLSTQRNPFFLFSEARRGGVH